MTESNVDELQRFLAENVEGYEELELLVWFHGESQGSRTVEQIAERLSIPEHLAQTAVDALIARGLVARDPSQKGRYYYAPNSATLHHAAGVLNKEYARNRLHVIHLMTDNALKRLRGSTLRTFADCFRVRGPKDHG